MKNILFLFASLCLSLSVHAGDSDKGKVSEIAILGKPIKVTTSNKEMSPQIFIHDFLISSNSDRCRYISKLKPSSWDKPELLLQNGGDCNEFDNVCVGKGIDNSLLVLENPTMGNKFLSMTVIPDTKSIASIKDVTQWKKYSLTETVPISYGSRNFVTLSDSTILIIGTPYSDLNHLFSVLNFKKPSISPLTYFPQDGVKASKLSKFDVYALDSRIYGNNKGRYFYQCEYSKFAFIFTIENNEVKIIKKMYSEYPDYRDDQSGKISKLKVEILRLLPVL